MEKKAAEKENKKTEAVFVKVILWISAFAWGLSYPFLWLILSAVTGVFLIHISRRNKGLLFYKGLLPASGAVFLAGVLVAWITGLDRGTAVYDVLRVSGLSLFILLIMQYDKDQIDSSIVCIADIACSIVLLSTVFYFFQPLRRFVFNNHRLGGTFQYSNTFALYLLLAVIIILHDPAAGLSGYQSLREFIRGNSIIKSLRIMILIAGILWTGSRMTFVLMAGVIICCFIRFRDKRKLIVCSLIPVFSIAAVIILTTRDTASIGRFLTISLSESTFIGRILYWKDALPLLIRYPLGLGYMGYFDIQPVIQTGVYSVRFVHNSWLQIALDHGLLSFAAFIVLYFVSVKRSSGAGRMMLVVTGIHMFFDIDLSFYAVVIILMLLFDWSGERRNELLADPDGGTEKSVISFPGKILPIPVAVFIYFSAFLSLEATGFIYDAARMYPWDSGINEKILRAGLGMDDAYEMCNRIISENPYNIYAWEVKADIEADKGNYEKMSDALRHYISLRKYSREAYDRYMIMLNKAAGRCEEEGKTELAGYLRQEASAAFGMMEKVKQSTSPLAYKIKDKPDL